MKPIISKIVLIAFLAFVMQSVQAQTLNKKSLLSELGDSGGAKFTSDQQKEFDSSNKKLADDLFNLDKNEKSKDKRDKGVDDLFDKRDNDIDRIFGNDSKYADVKKDLKKKSRGTRRKVKLAKLVL